MDKVSGSVGGTFGQGPAKKEKVIKLNRQENTFFLELTSAPGRVC